MDTAYSGALSRSAHFAFRPPVPGISPEHEHPDPEPDPFAPVPADVTPAEYDVWQPQDPDVHSDMVARPISHWAGLQQPVPTSVPREVAGIATTARMLANHSVNDFRPDTYIPYKHADQGRTIEYVTGRGSLESGEDIAEDMQYLVAGTNAYDFTNQPNEVYSADQGRYRLGVDINDFGLYDQPGKYGQDAELRAYTGLVPATPVDKPSVPNAAPYTPNSSGTTTWTLDSFQVPSMFSLPSETAMTDYEAANVGAVTAGQFDDGGRL